MKNVFFAFVEKQLPTKEYALPLVELTNQYPARNDSKTLEYCFKKQNPSKITIPLELLKQMQFKHDEDNGKIYMVIDGVIIERVVDNGFKRVQLTEKYRPAESASPAKESVE